MQRSVLTSARDAVSSEDNTVILVVIDAAKNMTGQYEAQLRDLLKNLVREACARERAEGMTHTELAIHIASCFTIVLNKVTSYVIFVHYVSTLAHTLSLLITLCLLTG